MSITSDLGNSKLSLKCLIEFNKHPVIASYTFDVIIYYEPIAATKSNILSNIKMVKCLLFSTTFCTTPYDTALPAYTKQPRIRDIPATYRLFLKLRLLWAFHRILFSTVSVHWLTTFYIIDKLITAVLETRCTIKLKKLILLLTCTKLIMLVSIYCFIYLFWTFLILYSFAQEHEYFRPDIVCN